MLRFVGEPVEYHARYPAQILLHLASQRQVQSDRQDEARILKYILSGDTDAGAFQENLRQLIFAFADSRNWPTEFVFSRFRTTLNVPLWLLLLA
tara:strand:- start:537 stop:818 length:282 start_codon:yes stop_codon:yes gene_type:complete